MVAVLVTALNLLVALFQSKSRPESENAARWRLTRDQDGIHGAVFRRSLGASRILDKPMSAGLPSRNCFDGRLTGECVGHFAVFGQLRSDALYYSETRTLRSLSNDKPSSRNYARFIFRHSLASCITNTSESECVS
jgi:hypothetical protein